MENLPLASSPQLDSVSPAVLRVPVPPAQGNFYEIGLTKALFSKLRRTLTCSAAISQIIRNDDVLLETGVKVSRSPSSNAHITGEEVRLEVPHWGRFSGFVSYANQSGLGQGPITGGLFIGSDAQGVPRMSGFRGLARRTKIRCGRGFVFRPLRACGLLWPRSMAVGCPPISETTQMWRR